MAANFKEAVQPSPQPPEYCTCRCNTPYNLPYSAHLDRFASLNQASLTQSLSHTTRTTQPSSHLDKDELVHKFRSMAAHQKGDQGGGQQSNYRNALNAAGNTYSAAAAGNANYATLVGYQATSREAGASEARDEEGKDSPVMSEGTDLSMTHAENSFDSGEFLEGLQCASCDKPLLLYTNLDFKLFDNWINYVFYHKTFSRDQNPSDTHSSHVCNGEHADHPDEKDIATAEGVRAGSAEPVKAQREPAFETGRVEGPSDEGGSSHPVAEGHREPEHSAHEHEAPEEGLKGPEGEQTWDAPESDHRVHEEEWDDIKSISDITSSILMSSEETLFSIINNISPGEHCTNEKNQLFDSVKRFLQYCLGEDTIVHLTGSTAYDIDIDYSDGTSPHLNSDLDIVLLSNSFGGDPRLILQKVYNELTNMQHVLKERNKCPIWVLADSNIKLVESAKVPIVIIETKNGLLCDISVNTLYPLLHTELFKSYIDDHPMVRPLMRIIKHWLLVRGLPSMKEGGFPSILWMSLFCNSLDATMVNASSNLEMLAKPRSSDVGSQRGSEAESEKVGKDEYSEYESNPEMSDSNYGRTSYLDAMKASKDREKNAKPDPAKSPELSLDKGEREVDLRDEPDDDPSSYELDYDRYKHQDYKSFKPDDDKSYKDDDEYKTYKDDDDDEEYDLSETYREMYAADYAISYGCSVGQLWERLQGSREEYGILCSLEKCFVNLSKGLSVMDIVNRFAHIKSGSDYGGMSVFCKNIIRLIEMEPNVPYGTWLVYYYELNRAKEYMALYSKRMEILVTLLVFLRLLSDGRSTVSDLKALAADVLHAFGYDLSHLWTSTKPTRRDEFNSLYVNNQYNLNVSASSDLSGKLSPDTYPALNSLTLDKYHNAQQKTDEEDLKKMLSEYLKNVSSLLRIHLTGADHATTIKLLIYHMFQQFKSIPNEVFERVQDSVYSIPVAIEPPTPIEEEPNEFGHRFECGLWDDSGWYIVVLQERLCLVKVIKICIEWDFWWSKEFVSRRDTRSIFHGFVYRQLRLDDFKKGNFTFSSLSVNSPSILIKRGSLVLFNPCDIVSKLHVLKVVKHEQFISPSLYSTDFYTGVKCLYVLPGFEVDRFMCFEQISHKLRHYVEFRPQVTFCKLCGIVNMKKINSYTEYKIPQRKLRNAKYVLCNQKYNYIYNVMHYKHFNKL